MKNRIVVAGLAASIAMAALTCGARASTYAFEVTTSSLTIDGGFATGAAAPGGGFEITSIWGAVNGSGITGLVPDPSYVAITGGTGPWIYDNVYYPGSIPTLDNAGVLFSTASNEYNIYSVGTTSPIYYVSTGTSGADYNPGEALLSASVTAVPEPSTWAMLMLGFAGLGFAGYRKTKSRMPALAA